MNALGRREVIDLLTYLDKNKEKFEGYEKVINLDKLHKIAASVFYRTILSDIEEEFIIDKFIQNNMIIDIKTPSVICKNRDCIISSIKKDINSIDFIIMNTRLHNDDELKEFVIDEALKQNYILKYNSPFFLKENYDIAINSIKQDVSSATYFVPTHDVTDEQMQDLIDLVIQGKYVVNENTHPYLSMNIDVVLSSIREDINSKIPPEMKKELIVIEELAKRNYDFSEQFIKESSLLCLKDEVIKNAFMSKLKFADEIGSDYDLRLKEFINRILESKLDIKTINDLFANSLENEWEKEKSRNSELYTNVFGKICGILRNNKRGFLNAIDGCLLLNIMECILKDKYSQLYNAMNNYYNIYHSNIPNKLKELEPYQDIISLYSSLYVAMSKENYKKKEKKRYERTIKSYFKLNLSNPIIYKQIYEQSQKRKFRKMIFDKNEEVVKFINSLKHKYFFVLSEDVIEKILDEIIYSDKPDYKNVFRFSLEGDFKLHEKVTKIINRLNNGFISICDKEIDKYREYIIYDHHTKKYLNCNDTFKKEEKKEYKKYKNLVHIFNKIKREIMLYVKELEVDELIDEKHMKKLIDELPFTDDNFVLDYEKILEETNISSFLCRVVTTLEENKKINILDDECYNSLIKIFADPGIYWFLSILHSNKYKVPIEFNKEYKDFFQMVSMSDSIKKFSHNHSIDISSFSKFMKVYDLCRYSDEMSINILGKNIIEELLFTYSSHEKYEVITEATKLVSHMSYRREKTIPYIEGEYKNYKYSIYDNNDTDILLCGIRTSSCFALLSSDCDFLQYCCLNKNGFVIKITDELDNFVGKASGFRNGNCVFINQLRTINDYLTSSYTNKLDGKDIINTFQEACIDMLNTSLNNKEENIKIEHIFATKSFSLGDCTTVVSDEVTEYIGDEPMNINSEDWLEFVNLTGESLGTFTNDSSGFITDYGSYPLVLIASLKNYNEITKDDIKLGDVPTLYKNNSTELLINGEYSTESIEKINRIKAINSYLRNEEYNQNQISNNYFIYMGNNWYVIINEDEVIDSDYIVLDEIAKKEYEVALHEIKEKTKKLIKK